MTATRYRFGPFVLDPQARELERDGERITLPISHLDCLVYLIRHRERPIGRDELGAAVWDRADVSDVSIHHAIMRLRKLLGDTGSNQLAIRTVPKLGYRWVLQVVEELHPIEPLASSVHQDGSDGTAVTSAGDASSHDEDRAAPRNQLPGRRPWRATSAIVIATLVLAALLTVAVLIPLSGSRQGTHATTTAESEQNPQGEPIALVLPAAARVTQEWAWLRLGLMDLIGNRLRENGLTVTPTEAVISLVAATRLPDRIDAWPDSALTTRGSLMIRPEATRTDDRWLVRLHFREHGGEQLVEASDADVLQAARQAADSLTVRRGLVPAPSPEGAADQVAEQTAQRIHAAVLAGQIDVARRLIAAAPDKLRTNPEIVLSQASIDFFSGEYAACATGVEGLLSQWSGEEQPRLRARALYQLGAAYVRLRRIEEADAAFAETIELIAGLNDPHTLAAAYTGRGVVAGLQLRLDDGAQLLGQARALHHMSNDAFGVVRVDLNLAAIALDRGQPAAALPILERTIVQLELMAIPEARVYALRASVDAHLMRLQVAEALATSERFWPPEQHSDNPRERWWLYLSRAVALTAAGHLADASALVEELIEHSDPDKDRFARIEADALRASIALLSGDNVKAAELASRALTPELEGANRLSHVTTWLTRIRGLHRAGQIETAADDVRSLREWADRQPQDWRMLFVVLAEAEQAHVENRLDDALAGYGQAMAMAESVGIPENLVVVGEFWIDALISDGQLDRASAVAGRLSQWAEYDWRAAWAQTRVYQAMGRTDHARRFANRARELAGERILPGPVTP